MWFMIRKLQKTDINRVADIWLDTNLKAHDFIPEQYWTSNYELVKEMMSQADGRKFNERTNFKNTNQTCNSDHGIIISWNIIQYYRYGMDRTSWIKSSCRSWCRRHVYVVFTRISFDVENGRTGTGSTMHWTRRQRRSP